MRLSPVARSLCAVALAGAAPLCAQPPGPAAFAPPADVEYRKATIISEGARLAAEVFAPRAGATAKLPCLVMAHGWGGVAASLRADAVVFARAGYFVTTFDYRGWGASD